MQNLSFTKTRGTIAIELQIDRKTLRGMLLRNGIDLPSGPVYLPWQKLIYETFSYPEGVSAEDYAGGIVASGEERVSSRRPFCLYEEHWGIMGRFGNDWVK